MSINYPSWVTDDSPIPAGYLVKVKKFLYARAGQEYVRRLYKAGLDWVKGRPLAPEQEAMLAKHFPGQWPDPPTMEQFMAYKKDVWEPRQDALVDVIAGMRQAVEGLELAWVDYDGLVD